MNAFTFYLEAMNQNRSLFIFNSIYSGFQLQLRLFLNFFLQLAVAIIFLLLLHCNVALLAIHFVRLFVHFNAAWAKNHLAILILTAFILFLYKVIILCALFDRLLFLGLDRNRY